MTSSGWTGLEYIRVEVEDLIATVTLARPPVNALSAPMMRELADVFGRLGRSREAHVAVLTADGDRLFCGGADIGESERRYSKRQLIEGESVADLIDPGTVVRDLFWGIRQCPLPVIASVNGIALGAGAALVACCDMVVAAENATFALPEIDVGVLGGARHLQRLVGVWKTREMMLSGKRVPAAELYRLGALAAVVPFTELRATTRELAATIAAKSPMALRMAKQSMNRVEHLSLEEGYQLEQDYTVRVSQLADSKEARAAWKERRAPHWTWS
ncbi:MAG: putative enoyl-CoA hydratase/isomerase [Pseudonocardiales bacterium]|nr:putative enoyl-CoA hydratase/isomerase [Pseudonocardiales bacterium]